MKIWHLPKGLAATAALMGLGAVLAGPQSAQATLIGDMVTVTSSFSDCPLVVGTPTCVDQVTVVTPAAEFTPGPNSGTELGDLVLFPGESVNIEGSSINFVFTAGLQGVMTFSDLQWQPPDGPGTVIDFNMALNSGALASFGNVVIDPTGTEIRIPFTVAAGGADFTVELITDHGPPPIGVPEPGALLMFGVGLAGLGWMARRRRRAA